jgi:hypothetical protein
MSFSYEHFGDRIVYGAHARGLPRLAHCDALCGLEDPSRRSRRPRPSVFTSGAPCARPACFDGELHDVAEIVRARPFA